MTSSQSNFPARILAHSLVHCQVSAIPACSHNGKLAHPGYDTCIYESYVRSVGPLAHWPRLGLLPRLLSVQFLVTELRGDLVACCRVLAEIGRCDVKFIAMNVIFDRG